MSLVSALEAPLSISNAIRKASRATGTDFSYLLKTAARESAFKKGAKAQTSSAAGLFQFIESTWLKTVKDVGDKFGLDKYTPHIFTTRSGRAYVPNEKLRQEILQLRYNPEVSAMMAGAFTQKNSEIISSTIGREPTQGELYIAHFLGAKGASELISRAENNPNARADRAFPNAARANRSIFYSQGRPRTVKQVYDNLVKDHAKQQAVTANASNATPAATASSLNIASAQINGSPAVAKPVVEPIKSFVPSSGGSAALVQQASIRQNPATGAATGLIGSGVEAKVIEAAPAKQAVGILGLKGSPIVNMNRVAALTHGGLNIPQEGTTGTASGSIGQWTTIIEPPAAYKAARENAPQIDKKHIDEPAPVNRRTARRQTGSRSQSLLEQSASRNAKPPPIRVASASRTFQQDFWDQISLGGS